MPAGFPSQVNWTTVRPPKPEPLAPTLAPVAALAGESPRAAAADDDALVVPAPVATATSAQMVSPRSPVTDHSATRSPFDEPVVCLGLGEVTGDGAAAHGLFPRRDELPAATDCSPFGNPAGSIEPRWLCGPALRRVCPFVDRRALFRARALSEEYGNEAWRDKRTNESRCTPGPHPLVLLHRYRPHQVAWLLTSWGRSGGFGAAQSAGRGGWLSDQWNNPWRRADAGPSGTVREIGSRAAK
jgi:hypothetical protein